MKAWWKNFLTSLTYKPDHQLVTYSTYEFTTEQIEAAIDKRYSQGYEVIAMSQSGHMFNILYRKML